MTASYPILLFYPGRIETDVSRPIFARLSTYSSAKTLFAGSADVGVPEAIAAQLAAQPREGLPDVLRGLEVRPEQHAVEGLQLRQRLAAAAGPRRRRDGEES